MFPTFLNGEYILTNLISLRFSDPKKGDVVVFQAPNDAEKDYIKRIIATEGDTVILKDGLVYLNGQLLNENAYLESDVKTYGGAFLREGETVTIPQGAYLVFGDNRPFSSDSREWGFIKKSDIVGQSMVVYWPVNKMELIRNPYSN